MGSGIKLLWPYRVRVCDRSVEPSRRIYARLQEVYSADVGIREHRSSDVRISEVSHEEFRPGEVTASQIGLAKRRPRKTSSGEIGALADRLIENGRFKESTR